MSTWVAMIVTAVVSVAGGGVLTWWRFRGIEQPQSRADIRKTEVETRAAEVQVLLSAMDGLRIELGRRDTAYTTISEAQARLERAHDESTRTVREVSEQLSALRTAAEEVRLLLADHGQWDQQVLAIIRETHPNFPDPPSLTLPPELTSRIWPG